MEKTNKKETVLTSVRVDVNKYQMLKAKGINFKEFVDNALDMELNNPTAGNNITQIKQLKKQMEQEENLKEETVFKYDNRINKLKDQLQILEDDKNDKIRKIDNSIKFLKSQIKINEDQLQQQQLENDKETIKTLENKIIQTHTIIKKPGDLQKAIIPDLHKLTDLINKTNGTNKAPSEILKELQPRIKQYEIEKY